MFFKDIADLKKYVSVNKAMSFDDMKVSLNDVDRSILKNYLGKDFLSELQTSYNASIAETPTPLTGTTLELVEMLRASTANFALANWAPSGQLSIDSSGIRINSTAENKTAFQWQIKDLIDTCNQRGFNALDEALIFLADNIADFDTYKDSDEFKENASLFLSSAKDFTKYYSAFSNSPVQFWKVRSIIRKVEDFVVKAVLLPDLYTEMKEDLAAGTELSPENKKLLAYIKPLVAHFTISRAINELAASINPNGFLIFNNTSTGGTINNAKSANTELVRIGHAAEQDAKTYYKQLADFLEANKDEYPTYTGDATYTAATTAVDLNDDDNNFYAAI